MIFTLTKGLVTSSKMAETLSGIETFRYRCRLAFRLRSKMAETLSGIETPTADPKAAEAAVPKWLKPFQGLKQKKVVEAYT